MYIVLNLSHVLQLSIITGQSYYDNIPSIGKGTASITVPFRPAKNMAKSVDLEAGMKTIIIGQKENLSNFASSDCHSERVWSFAISNS